MTTSPLETQLRSFFGFASVPFAKSRKPANPFLTEPINHALERLGYLLDRRGSGALFGHPGSGKSTLLRLLMNSLSKATHLVCYVSHTSCGILDLFRTIARGFQLQPSFRKADLVRQIQERILKLSREQGIRPLLILDDAHLLPSFALDDLRLLTSFDGDSRDDLTLILAGHPQLETNLSLAINEAVAQRLILRLRLRPLLPKEVAQYLAFRLELAGRTAKIFLPEAFEAIARASRGIPRLIDRLAENALLHALQGQRKEIDAELITQAAEDIRP